jgi:tetratricopeptide (TPR) repeat protein
MDIFSHFSVARELLQQGELEKALAEVDRVVSIFGQSVEALELQVEIRGAIFLGSLSPKEKLERLRQEAIDCNNTAQFDRALELVEVLLLSLSKNAHCWYVKGYALSGLTRYEEAIASFDKAIEFEHDHQVFWYVRGNLLGNLGRHEEAIASFDKAIEFKQGAA